MEDKYSIIKITNCNCIKEANIRIELNSLNIKYGCNGLGKSTISKAVKFKSSNNEEGLESLRPYSPVQDDLKLQPYVSNLPFSNVKVFNEDYVNSYLFEQTSFLSNSFQVFLRSIECDQLSEDIDQLLSDLKGVFQQSETIEKLQNFLPKFCETVKFNNGSISKKGGVGEFIKGNGAGFEKYEALEPYKPYFQNRDIQSVSKWAKWRNDGIKEIINSNCPFCTSVLETENIEVQNSTISTVFKNSALSTANSVLSFVQEAIEMNYISENSITEIKSYIGNKAKEDSLYAELLKLASETDYLYKKISKIVEFKPMNVSQEQLIAIEENLEEMIIDNQYISKYYSTDLVLNLTNEINRKIDDLKANTGKLKGLFIKHDKKMRNLIGNREEDINHFLSLAGFPYKFYIKTNGANQAKSFLTPYYFEDTPIVKLDEHLSWGEKNAFSLVMFMFESISENADLIVLDDPITSFDKDKKFAIIRRMFDNKKESFKNASVLMLTHDLQPVIDYIHGNFFSKFGLTTKTKATFLINEQGVITEQPIEKNDLLNTIVLTEDFAKCGMHSMAVRVVNLRKYIELTNRDYLDDPLYEVLSNIIHGRNVPTNKNGIELEPLVFESGCVGMSEYFGAICYEDILNELHPENLINIISTNCKYEKIVAIRLLFERFPTMRSEIRKLYPSAYKFTNETNHLENDFIFQLNPLKYLSIPEVYLTQLSEFIFSGKFEFS